MGFLIQRFFFALGGLALWIYCNFMNIVFDKKYKKNIEFYLFEEVESGNSGLNSSQLKFVLGIFMFILILVLIQYFES